jgi:hypothetical protein
MISVLPLRLLDDFRTAERQSLTTAALIETRGRQFTQLNLSA